MGLDGGTYITRSDVLRGASWALSTADTSRSSRGGNVQAGTVFKRRRLDPRADKAVRWSTCALTGQPLAPPIAADWLGNLLNRAAALEFLLGRAAIFADDAAQDRYINLLRVAGLAYDHLRSKRDVFTVQLAGRPAAEMADGTSSSRFVCPVTDALCEQVPFAALVPCGHAFSDRAIRQMTDNTCALCGVSFGAADIVPLNGTDEQVAAQHEILRQRREQQSHRQAKKDKRKAAERDASAGKKTSAAKCVTAGDAAAVSGVASGAAIAADVPSSRSAQTSGQQQT